MKNFVLKKIGVARKSTKEKSRRPVFQLPKKKNPEITLERMVIRNMVIGLR
jgi:hypothetical protein